MGDIFLAHLCPLVPIEHRLNTTAYPSIVADHPFMSTVYPSSDGYFQQDNAPYHKAQIISDWFLEHGNELILLKWPPQSPDLNPIEHLWDVVEIWSEFAVSVTSGYLSYCCLSIISNQSAHSPLTSDINKTFSEICIMDVQPTNLQQLRDAIMSIWSKISEECFQHLVESMSRRIKAVLKSKGDPTRY